MARLLFVLLCIPALVYGHGRLIGPPSRSSMWRFGFDNPPNYNDMSLYCGGFGYQQANGGKCGVCGDKWDGPFDNEAGGTYGNGIIVDSYSAGQTIDVKVELTASHWGWFEFRLCPNSPTERFDHACLNQHLLELESGGTRYQLPHGNSGIFDLRVKLPAGLTCDFCTIQWKYNTANSWGTDPDTGEGCLGCGAQEQFYGCSDVTIA